MQLLLLLGEIQYDHVIIAGWQIDSILDAAQSERVHHDSQASENSGVTCLERTQNMLDETAPLIVRINAEKFGDRQKIFQAILDRSSSHRPFALSVEIQ